MRSDWQVLELCQNHKPSHEIKKWRSWFRRDSSQKVLPVVCSPRNSYHLCGSIKRVLFCTTYTAEISWSWKFSINNKCFINCFPLIECDELKQWYGVYRRTWIVVLRKFSFSWKIMKVTLAVQRDMKCAPKLMLARDSTNEKLSLARVSPSIIWIFWRDNKTQKRHGPYHMGQF